MITDVFLDEEMDMPCLCDCGEWFDLNNGFSSKIRPNQLVCQSCHNRELDARITIKELKVGDKFLYDGDECEVTKRYTKSKQALMAKPEFGGVRCFYDEDEEVIKL